MCWTGQWVAVYGCRGAGISAVMLAVAAGAQVVAVDLSPDARALAGRLGAAATVDAAVVADTAAEIRTLTEGGAHISLDCVGSPAPRRRVDRLFAQAGQACPGRSHAAHPRDAADPDGPGDRSQLQIIGTVPACRLTKIPKCCARSDWRTSISGSLWVA